MFFPSTSSPSKGEFFDFPKNDSGLIFQALDKSNTDISASDCSFIIPKSRFKIFAGFTVRSLNNFSTLMCLFFTRFKESDNNVSKPTPPNSA